MLEDLETRELFALNIVFNYAFDTSNFFDTAAKKALLDLAATTYEGRIIDSLTAITPGGSNTWNQVIANPATGAQIDGSTTPSLHNVSVDANSIIVYVGAHDLPGSTLGQGGFGGYSVSGTQDFVNDIQFRGQSGVGTTDFAPWGGSIAFDSNTNWFFNTSIAGITNVQSDFLSVAIHELGHVLGFGTSDSFAADRSGLSFTGVNARNKYDAGGGSIPLADTGHWAEGTKDGGFEASMDPTVTNGTRKTFTELDFGALVDLGWTLTNHTPVLDTSGSPTLTAIAEDTNNNPGTLVSALLTGGGGTSVATDADAFAMQGIAVTAVDNTNGVWQFTLNNGTLWTPFNSVSPTAAMLLSNDPSTKVRFVPTANYFGTVSGGISYKAWDQTAGNAGSTANSTGGGATSAFSAAVETASITVTPVNDTPTNITLSNLTVNENSPNGTVVGTLSTVDADPGDTFTYTLLVNAGGRFALNGNQVVVANSALLDFETNASHSIQVRSADQTNLTFVKNFTITVVNQNEVVNRQIFYNNSKFDGNNAAAGAADDAAIATDKSALRPGGTATFANYTSYSRGINGVIFDVEHLALSPTVADFDFRVGNDNTPAGWVAAPAPASLLIRTGAGIGGSDRVELTWADGTIKKTWLQVTVKATAATGLPTADVFYFGNAVGESGNTSNAVVNSTDEVQARLNTRTFLNPALVDNVFDYNRDGLVNATDQIIARANSTIAATALKWITVPSSLTGMSASVPELVSASALPSGEPLDLAALAVAEDILTHSGAKETTAASVAASDQGAILQAKSVNSELLNNAAAPSALTNAAGSLDLSARAHLASRGRTIDTVAPTANPGADASLAVDWMARVAQFRRRIR